MAGAGCSGLIFSCLVGTRLLIPVYHHIRKEFSIQSIESLTNDIRDVINHSRLRDELPQYSDAWNMLCSSLDAIEDTNSCLDAFLMTDISFDTGNQHLDDGKKYMYVYGTLQAMFVQQDAVEHLAEALQIPYTLDSSLKQIRDIRNDSVGHATKRGAGKRKTFNFITRISIDNQGYTLGTAYADGRPDSSKEVNIPDLISTQRSILTSVLGSVLKILTQLVANH